MSELQQLPLPSLDARLFGARRIPLLSDDPLFRQTGVRIAFSGREGGVSSAPFDTLNLGSHVSDDATAVERNRALLLQALGAPDASLIVPNQVHRTDGVTVSSRDAATLQAAREAASKGADYLVVEPCGIAALLCFADCASVIIVSPTGRFAVAHAGWRGAVAGIASQAASALAARDEAALDGAAAQEYNAYIGPHIHAECFECGEDVVGQFVEAFGGQAAPDARHVDLATAIRIDLMRAGLSSERIIDSGICTRCDSVSYYSYRASGGVCGRHGAVALRFAQ